MKYLIILPALLIPTLLFAQDSLGINYFYQKIDHEFPTAQKTEIQNQITNLKKELAKSGLLPNVLFSASASFQSDVTEVPFAPPGMAPQFSKDHYNISVDVNQILFDGGKSRIRQNLETKTGEAENSILQLETWQIRKQLEKIYFSILMLQKNRESFEVMADELERQIAVVEAKVVNGVLLPGNQKVMQAELLKVQQQIIHVNSALETGYQALGILTNEQISEASILIAPDISEDFEAFNHEIEHPKLDLLQHQNEVLGVQKTLAAKKAFPTISAFGKAAYGRPGLNAFDDDLQSYWIVGLKTQWSIKSWSNSSKKAEILRLQQRKLEEEREIIRRQIRSESTAIMNKIQSLEKQIQLEEEILKLRNEVVLEKENQLNQGVITSTEFISELNAEHQARLSLNIKQLQILQAKIEYLNTTGISWN